MTSELYVRRLTKTERKNVYQHHMKQDFPKNELRPLRMIESLTNKGNYYMYGVFLENEICAYACLWEDTNTEILLFDYFAVISTMRGKGYGTAAMKELLETCNNKKGVILEVENPDSAESEEEREIRNRRIAFYEKSGLQMSEVRTLLFGVEYCMMYRELSGMEIQSEITKVLERLYGSSMPKPMYEKMFRILWPIDTKK